VCVADCDAEFDNVIDLLTVQDGDVVMVGINDEDAETVCVALDVSERLALPEPD